MLHWVIDLNMEKPPSHEPVFRISIAYIISCQQNSLWTLQWYPIIGAPDQVWCLSFLLNIPDCPYLWISFDRDALAIQVVCCVNTLCSILDRYESIWQSFKSHGICKNLLSTTSRGIERQCWHFYVGQVQVQHSKLEKIILTDSSNGILIIPKSRLIKRLSEEHIRQWIKHASIRN